MEGTLDTDEDGIPDYLDDDDDNDGIPDYLDEDADGNGLLDRYTSLDLFCAYFFTWPPQAGLSTIWLPKPA